MPLRTNLSPSKTHIGPVGHTFHIQYLSTLLAKYSMQPCKCVINFLRDDPVCQEKVSRIVQRDDRELDSHFSTEEGECQCGQCPHERTRWCCRKFPNVKRECPGI